MYIAVSYTDLSLEEHKVTNYVSKIDKALLGWKSSTDGAWNKAALTTSLSKFLGYYCATRNLEANSEEEFRLVDLQLQFINFISLLSRFVCFARFPIYGFKGLAN